MTHPKAAPHSNSRPPGCQVSLFHKATTPLFLAGGAEALPGRWLAILGLYDLVFGLLAYAVFDYLVED